MKKTKREHKRKTQAESGSKAGSKKAQKAPVERIEFVIGIDEVGRGPLAGPVTVCGCMMPFSFYKNSYKQLGKMLNKNHKLSLAEIRDSKKLRESERERLFEKLNACADLRFALHSNTAKEIDARGIAVAIRASIAKILHALIAESAKMSASKSFDPSSVLVLLDGSLFAPAEFSNQRTIIKGDDLEKAISCASIYAKVSRDRFMKKLDRRLEKSSGFSYGFGIHKGYGTAAHRQAIKKFGLSDFHRKTFCRKMA